jgi:hypothetical protein
MIWGTACHLLRSDAPMIAVRYTYGPNWQLGAAHRNDRKMAGYRPTQIRKPSDETEFERNCVVLFKDFLADPNVKRVRSSPAFAFVR